MELKQISENVFVIHGFLSQEECDSFRGLSEEQGYNIATVQTEKGSRVIPGLRKNKRVMYKDEKLATQLWEKAKNNVPKNIGNSYAVGFNELFRFYKYEQGDQFRKHIDESFIKDEFESSYYTFMIYLNDDYEGGETTFDDARIKGETGMALIFLHTLAHAGTEVTSGIKYVIRTDVMYRLKTEEQK